MDLKLPGLQSTGWQSVHARSSRPNRGTHAATHQGMRLFGRPMTAPSPAKTAVLDASRTGDSPGGERPATATENTSAFQPLQHTSEHLIWNVGQEAVVQRMPGKAATPVDRISLSEDNESTEIYLPAENRQRFAPGAKVRSQDGSSDSSRVHLSSNSRSSLEQLALAAVPDGVDNRQLSTATNASLFMRETLCHQRRPKNLLSVSADSELPDESFGTMIGDGRPLTRENERLASRKQEWSDEQRRQVRTCNHLEKEVAVSVKRLQSMGADGAACSTERTRFESARQEESEKLKTGLRKVGAMVSRMRSELQHAQTDEHYLSNLRKMMDATEAEIVSFKNDQRRTYEILRKTESSLTRELELFADLMEDWDTPATQTGGMPTSQIETSDPAGPIQQRNREKGTPFATGSANGQTESFPVEVTEFEAFVAKHGNNGGWETNDHEAFLSIWLRHVRRGTNRQDGSAWYTNELFVDSVCGMVPAATGQMVVDHASWYQKYTELLDAKRSAVKIWRQKRDEERELRRKAAEAATVDFSVAPKLKPATNDKQRKENARKLADWRQKRQTREAEETEQRRVLEEKEDAKRIVQERRRAAERERVAAAKAVRKSEAARQEGLLQDTQHQRSPSSVGMARLQQRDREWQERQRARISSRQRQTEERLERAAQLAAQSAPKVAAQRDPTRVFQPTMNSLLRIEVNEDGGGEAGPAEIKGSRKTSLGSARHTKRATPSWRKT